MTYLIENNLSEIKKLYNKVDSNKEFEFMIYNNSNYSLSYQDYLSCLEFLSKRSKIQKLRIENINTLDINYINKNNKLNKNYRITIEGLDNINKYVKLCYDWKNHVIYKILITKYLANANDITILEKIKSTEDYVDITDYNIRVRLSEENNVDNNTLDMLKSLNFQEQFNISFRFKERVSVYILDDKNKYIKIDLTKTITTNSIKKIDNIVPKYELEIEYMNNSKPKSDDDLNLILKETELLLKIIQQSNFIISKTNTQNVLKEYSKILSLNYNKIEKLNGRKPESLEIQYLTEILPNKYAVTDKADGERNFLIIINREVYFINSNLHVKKTGIILDKKLEKYNGSILDGENIFLPKENRHLMMIFDCLFNGNKDIRENPNFMERLKEADDIISNCFILNKQRGFDFKDYKSKNNTFDLDDISHFHEINLKEYMDNLNFDISLEKKFPLIRRKYFINALGVKPWEIFKYSSIIWEKYTEDTNIKCPYLLDGLIYHPLNQKYITTKDTTYVEFKWKPPKKNSVDLYIIFEKDPDTGKILTVYDNSGEENIRNKPYRIVNLYVGKNNGTIEEPVPFRENENDGSQAYIFLQDGDIRDLDGKVISDKTVVEFFYNDDPEIDPKFRWTPIRTRYDKTESVMKYKKGYGNYINVANKVWRSIINPILMSDFQDLAKGNDYYDKKIEFIRSKIGQELIISTNKENVYYTAQNKMVDEWKQFNNYIKSIIIYTHCNYIYTDKRKLSILEIGVGRGGDIMKYYYGNIDFLLGIDPSKDGLLNPSNGAISRYNKFRAGKPRFPKMEFIQGTGNALFNYDDQFRALNGISNDDKIIMEKYFSKDKNKRVLFDRISCQFSIHYMFGSKNNLQNFKQNINDYLKPGGFLIATCFDAEKVNNLFNDTDKFSTYYTNDKGEKKLLFQIIKKYTDKKKDEIFEEGNAIDFYGAWMFQEGQYETEYLVDENFITKQFLKDCDLELIDTGMFDVLYDLNKEFITKYSNFESVQDTRKFLSNTSAFYKIENTDIHKSCIINASITRYYVFRKKDKDYKVVLNNKSSKNIIGGDSSEELCSDNNQYDDFFDFTNDKKYFLPQLKLNENSLYESIFEVLKTHKIIPKTEKIKKFFKLLNIKIDDNKQTIFSNKVLQDIGNKIIIQHENENDSEKMVINGISIITIQKTDDDRYIIEKPDELQNVNIILLKDGTFYTPIYIIDKQFNKKGLFTKDNDFLLKAINY